MKISKRQIEALSLFLYDELYAEFKAKLEEYRKSKSYKEAIQKECKKYEPALKLVKSGLIANFNIPDNWKDIKGESDIKEIIIDRLEESIQRPLSPSTIANKLHILSIENTDMDTLLKAFRSSL